MTTDSWGKDSWGFDTVQVHAGAIPDSATRARATPIYATTSFLYADSEQASASFALEDLESYAYTRLSNPTNSVAEERIARLEGGRFGIAVASGQAATSLALLNLLRTGDHIVSSAHVYGGTTNLFLQRFAELGIATTLVSDIGNADAWRAAITDRTRALFAESIGNPIGSVLDIASIAAIAHEAGVPLIVDNTLATPYLIRPIEHGADIVVHSTSKYLSGHGTVIGGVVVDAATFDFGAEPEKWPGLTTPNVVGEKSYWERFSGLGLAYALRLRTTVLRDYGPAASPFNSFQLLQGLETLSLRVRQHVANATAIAEYLEGHDRVTRVHYAGLASSPWAANAAKYAPRGAGAIVSFEIAGGREAGREFVEGLRLFSHLANIGDTRSLVIHPASTLNSSLSNEQLESAGITASLVRLSIGIEDVRDLIDDLDTGFAAIASPIAPLA